MTKMIHVVLFYGISVDFLTFLKLFKIPTTLPEFKIYLKNKNLEYLAKSIEEYELKEKADFKCHFDHVFYDLYLEETRDILHLQDDSIYFYPGMDIIRTCSYYNGRYVYNYHIGYEMLRGFDVVNGEKIESF